MNNFHKLVLYFPYYTTIMFYVQRICGCILVVSMYKIFVLQIHPETARPFYDQSTHSLIN